MKRKLTTLVLGAGSSKAFGFPVGSELRKKLLELKEPHRRGLCVSAGLMEPPGELDEFIDAFRRSQMESIDAFLARRSAYIDIGKRAIATILLEIENESSLYQSEPEDCWHRYLFNRISVERWENINFENLAVITFNYDRSFETFLLGAFQASYGVSLEEAANALRGIRIFHVYGRLGSPFPDDGDHIPYGVNIDPGRVELAAHGIRVIPEGRDDFAALLGARNALVKANRIVFLGFGFDQTNLERLKAVETCKTNIGNPTRSRKIVATCKGMTQAEMRRAYEAIGQTFAGSWESERAVPPGFYSENCITALRESLILS